MPCYSALALLLGSAMAMGGAWIRRGSRVLFVVAGCAAAACVAILIYARHLPTPGDISGALGHHPSVYTLSLGHMEDLTIASFAYLRFPLFVAAVAFLLGAVGNLRWAGRRAILATALMMVIFFHAARLAMVVFDPYLSSRPIADELLKSPPGKLLVDHHYFTFSSVFFYLNSSALLVNGRFHNLEYGSYAPGAPSVFIDDTELAGLWASTERYYLVADRSALPRFEKLMGAEHLNMVIESGGKVGLTNIPFPGTHLRHAGD